MGKLSIKLCFVFIFIVCISNLNGQSVFPLTGHPRLFFLSSDEAILKDKLSSTPLLSKAHDVIVAECTKNARFAGSAKGVDGNSPAYGFTRGDQENKLPELCLSYDR